MTQVSLMSAMTEEEKKKFKSDRLEYFRSYHKDLINDLGISKMDFNVKMAFYDKQGRKVVGIFPSEFKKEKGFYFELITRDLDPLFPDTRSVFRLPYNTSFEEEFEMNERGSYLVPLEELRTIDKQSVAISKYSAVSINDKFTSAAKLELPETESIYKAPAPMDTADAPYSEMTIRDYYAIHTGKPVSSKTWLNDLIKSSK